MIYECREQAQVLYVIPVSSILGRLPLVPPLSRWVQLGQYPLPCSENQQTFPEHHATDQQTVVMDVGGGT